MVVFEELSEPSDDELPPLRPVDAKPRNAGGDGGARPGFTKRADGIPPVGVSRAPASRNRKADSLNDLDEDDDSDDSLPPLVSNPSKGRTNGVPRSADKDSSSKATVPAPTMEDIDSDDSDLPPLMNAPPKKGIAAALAKQPPAAKAGGVAAALKGRGVAAALKARAPATGASVPQPPAKHIPSATCGDPGIDSEDNSDGDLPPLISQPRSPAKATPLSQPSSVVPSSSSQATHFDPSTRSTTDGVKAATPVVQAQSQSKIKHDTGKQEDGAKLLAVAETQLAADELEEALDSATEARLLLRKNGNELMGAEALRVAIKAQLLLQRSDAALAVANEELEIFQMSNSPQEEAMVLLCVADVQLAKEQPNEALVGAEQALSLLRELGDKKGQAAALQVQMRSYFATQRHRQALHVGNEALTLYRAVGDTHGYSSQLLELPKLYLALGNVEEALSTAQKGTALYKRIGNKKREAIAWIAVTEAHLAKERSVEAFDASQQAVSLLGNSRLAATAQRLMGIAQLNQGARNEALNHVQQALTIARGFADRTEIGLILDSLIQIHAKSNGRAAREMEEEIQQAKRSKDFRREAQALHKLSQLLKEDRPKEALLKAGEALKILKKVHAGNKAEAEVLNTIADMYLAARNCAEALKVAEQAQVLLREAGDTRGVVNTLQLLTTIHLEMQEPEKGLQACVDQREVYRSAGYRDEEAAALLGVADMMKQLQGPAQAMKAVKEARLLYQAMDNQKEEAQALLILTNLQFENGTPAEALRSAKESFALCQDADYRAGQSSALEVMAHIHLQRNDIAECTRIADDMVKLCRAKSSSDDRTNASCLQSTAEVHLRLATASQGKPNSRKFIGEALQSAEGALKLFRSLSDQQGVVKNLQQVAQAQIASGNAQSALKNVQEASSICAQLQDHQGMAASVLIAAEASLACNDAQTAMRQAQEAATLFQQLNDSAGHEGAMQIYNMAQEKLEQVVPVRGRLDSPHAKGTGEARPTFGAGRASSPSSSRSAQNGTRRGGLGFNTFGRNPFEL